MLSMLIRQQFFIWWSSFELGDVIVGNQWVLPGSLQPEYTSDFNSYKDCTCLIIFIPDF